MAGEEAGDWLERLYEHLPWPMRPGEEGAEERFRSAVEFFSSLLRHESLSGIGGGGKRTVSVLDAMCGTGIAGAAAARALVDGGFRVRLVAADRRAGDLPLDSRWLEVAGIRGEVELETAVADVGELPARLGGRGRFDLILIWGSSMPHLNPWAAARALAGLREISDPGGSWPWSSRTSAGPC